MPEQTPRLSWPYPSKEDDPWFDAFVNMALAMDVSGFASREDRHLIMGEGGTVAWDLGTSTLSWGSDFFINGMMTGFRSRVAPGSVVLDEGEVFYVTLTRNPLTNVYLAVQKLNVVPSTDNDLALAFRLDDKIYWRTGLMLSDGDTATSVSPSGSGGADLTVREQDGVPTVATVSEIRVTNGTLTDEGGGVVSLAIGGASPVHFTQNGPISAIVTPTDFTDGLREMGVAQDVVGIVLSQEIDGSGGNTIIELYKVDTAGVETQVSFPNTVSLASGGGAKARILSASFIGTNAQLLATDRIGIKVTSVQAGSAADVTVTVLMGGASALAPTIVLPEDNEITQPINATVLGTTPTLVGSVYLPAGTIVGASSRFMLGADQVADTVTLELRRFTGGAVLDTITATGVLQEAQPGGDIVVADADWYDLYLYADVVTTNAILRGLRLLYTAGSGTRIRQAFDQTQTGTTPLLVGSVYLPAGTLQAVSRSMLGTTGGGTATLELRRFTGGAVITSWDTTGALADTPLAAAATIPASDWYDVFIYGDAGPTVAVVKGMDWTVLT